MTFVPPIIAYIHRYIYAERTNAREGRKKFQFQLLLLLVGARVRRKGKERERKKRKRGYYLTREITTRRDITRALKIVTARFHRREAETRIT